MLEYSQEEIDNAVEAWLKLILRLQDDVLREEAEIEERCGHCGECDACIDELIREDY